jgi:hypothetical protein
VNASGSGRSAKEELLEQLMVAAREQDRQLQAARRPRRRRRRGLGVVVAIGLGAAAAAGAADLISTGEPLPDRTLRGPRNEPPAGQGLQLVARAADPTGKTTWGVGVHTSGAGEACVMAGQVRGQSLGLIRDGRFRPYEPGTSGICEGATPMPLVYDRLTIRGAQPRTVVFGLTHDDRRFVTAMLGNRSYTARPAPGGAFLFVFSGTLPLDQPELGVGAAIGR